MLAPVEPHDDEDGSLWWYLFDTKQQELQLWICLRGWRFVALRKKRRFVKLTEKELLEIEFFENDLALHAVVSFISDGAPETRLRRFAWVRHVVELAPTAPEMQDKQQRVALHYALEQTWDDHDQLSWLAAKSEKALLSKDAQGQCLMTHALQHACPREIVMVIAVELARSALQSLEELRQNRHFESARRLCTRMVEQYFAGVPNFPHSFCLQLLRQKDDPVAVIDGMQVVWREFIDKWGYYGVPTIQDDLPVIRHAPLDSFLQLTIKARGEPLSYQWFMDNEPIAGATQSSLFVSQCVQPHNEGLYHCEVSNWKGRLTSTVMQLVVVDDRHGPDPSLRFLLSKSDCEALRETDIVHRVSASRGHVVHAMVSPTQAMEGCVLLLPPKCFRSFDANGIDVSDSVGMEVVVREADDSRTFSQSTRSEKLVSSIIEVLPLSVPELVQPAILSIPHCWSVGNDSLHELIVIELPAEGSTLSSGSKARKYTEVDRARVLEPLDPGVVSFEITRFGRFAVITRSLSAVNKESEPPLEEVLVYVLHPSEISTAQQRASSDGGSLTLSLWLALNRPDSIHRIHQELRTKKVESGDCRWKLSALAVRLRASQVLYLCLGHTIAISHTWRGVNPVEDLQQTAGVACVRRELVVSIHDLALDPQNALLANDSDGAGVTVFRELGMNVSVIKQSAYPSLKRSSVVRNGAQLTQPDGQVLSEKAWHILIPVLHDATMIPPQPTLHQRRLNQLAFAYAPPSGTTVSLFDELHEMEREFTPYFYTLELARFTETFWQRYDRTWWFDKTKSEILLGMYKVAHAGIDPYTVIACDAFAGAFRVVQCSLDAFGRFSEPMLLEPPSDQDRSNAAAATAATLDDDDDDNLIPRGLRRVLTLPASLDMSPQTHASVERLEVLLQTAYMSCSNFAEFFGVERNLHTVCLYLERHRELVRAAHREVALLILATDRLDQRVHERIFLRSKFLTHTWSRLRLIRRLIPELDAFPNEYAAVITALHTILRDFFEIVVDFSSPGWFGRFLLDQWHEADLHVLTSRLLRLLRDEALPLQGSQELTSALEADEPCPNSLEVERHSLRQLREYVLLITSQLVRSTSNKPSVDEISRELAAMIQRLVPLALISRLPVLDWEELVAEELQCEATHLALQRLREHDTLPNHIRSIAPADQQRFSTSSLFPTCITVCFGLHVVFVDTQHALKVTNANLRCGVQGLTIFSRERRRLVFTPSIPFDKHTRYVIKLRAQYVHTAFGGPLQPSATMTFEFATAS